MTLAQRVRDCRYSKGWGPDELASRAEISRTALYQIESGKTGLPRAGTLRRIAVALNVPMEDLLGHEAESETVFAAVDRIQSPRMPQPSYGWVPSEGGSLALPQGGNFAGLGSASTDDPRFAVETVPRSRSYNHQAAFHKGG